MQQCTPLDRRLNCRGENVCRCHIGLYGARSSVETQRENSHDVLDSLETVKCVEFSTQILLFYKQNKSTVLRIHQGAMKERTIDFREDGFYGQGNKQSDFDVLKILGPEKSDEVVPTSAFSLYTSVNIFSSLKILITRRLMLS